jgi:hypothetical protein
MGKRRVRWTKESIERRLAEGRGDGAGINYQPWLRVQDVPSGCVSDLMLPGVQVMNVKLDYCIVHIFRFREANRMAL